MSYEFKFPDVGEGLTEGKILEFKVNPGEQVAAGDILAIVETDKVVAEIASPRTGVLRRYGSKAGNRISVGETLAFIDVDDDDNGTEAPATAGDGEYQALVGSLDAAPSILAPSDERSGGDDAKSRAAANADGAGGPAATGDKRPGSGAAAPAGPATDAEHGAPSNGRGPAAAATEPVATPAARRLARDLGVDLDAVAPSRESGRIVRADIARAAQTNAGATRAAGGANRPPAAAAAAAAAPAAGTTAPPAPAGGGLPAVAGAQFAFPLIDDPLVTPSHLPLGQTVELTILRKTIAHTMEKSRKIPTATIFDLGVVDDLVDLRSKVNEGREVRVSFQPFFMKALATALRRYPVLNAHFDPTAEELTVYRDVNIGFAVNTEAGLMVPVIHSVENKTIREIDAEMKDFVERAKSRAIGLDALRGGTFSLTNFGPFGGLYASPMIYPPQVGILGAGRIHQAPMVQNGSVQPAWVLPVSLAFDHRVVDGVPAAGFVSYMLELLRSPQELFVSM